MDFEESVKPAIGQVNAPLKEEILAGEVCERIIKVSLVIQTTKVAEIIQGSE